MGGEGKEGGGVAWVSWVGVGEVWLGRGGGLVSGGGGWWTTCGVGNSDKMASSIYQLLPKEGLLHENLTKVSTIMSEYCKDRRAVTYGCLGLLGFGLTLKYGQDVRHRFFAWLNNKAIQMKKEDYEEIRRELFVSVPELKSHYSELRKENALKILEIGVGVGTNLTYYPDGSHLIVIDPNPHFVDYYNKNRANYPNIKSENVIVSTGEEMDMVVSDSVDMVVTTAVLCSVTDVTKVVNQIKRVLVPGGRYYFMEHIKEWDMKQHWFRLFLQHTLSLFLWPFLFDGCILNRDPVPIIEAVGFTKVQTKHLYAPMPMKVFTLASPHVKGVATK
ncbi:hypothetical protein Pmani_018821 [Petrolisthes manimaculis]|uniref:Methyltransferase type 11 domain-containing protein n=1 Tax=Petrolisthes manimaculis TaxID=1843537 RepID=A0AAE1U459_9EUCA|nr:hypothetical protein Pmani_018821 [Petrolisthes manimaculis]